MSKNGVRVRLHESSATCTVAAISVQIIILNCYLCNVLRISGISTYGNTEIPLMTKLIQMYLLLKLCGVIDGKNIL